MVGEQFDVLAWGAVDEEELGLVGLQIEVSESALL